MRDHSLRHPGLLSPAAPDGDGGCSAPLDPGAVRRRVEGLLEEGGRDRFDRSRAEALLTDGAALLLQLERTRLSAKRRRRAALLDAAVRPGAAQEALGLADEEHDAEQQIAELRKFLGATRRQLTLRLAD